MVISLPQPRMAVRGHGSRAPSGKTAAVLSEGHGSQDLSTAVPWARHPPQAFLSSHVKRET